VTAQPLDPDEGSGRQYFMEPLDLAAGLLDEGDELAAFHFDSRRFEPLPDDGAG